jgi:hypothetical protein
MEKTLESCLTNQKVIVKFYRRKKGNITDNPKHVANGGMLETSFKELVPPMLRNGQMKNILNDSEKEFLEDYMKLDKGTLSIYNKKFWDKRKVILYKENNSFDLSDPNQYIDYKILVANSSIIAPSLEDVKNKATYWFYIEREGEEESRKAQTLTVKEKAYSLLSKYGENKEVLRYILRQTGKTTAKNTKMEMIRGWIGELIDEKPNVFVRITSDNLLKTKVFINQAVDLGVITLMKEEYFDGETSKPIAAEGLPPTLENAAAFLNEPRQQEYKLMLEAKVKINKD